MAVASALTLSLSLAACGRGAGQATDTPFKSRIDVPTTDTMVDASQYKTDAPWTIGYSDASLSNSARVTIWQFTQWAASEYPQIDKVVRTNADDNPNQQTSDIQDLVSRGVDCLIVSATSTDAVVPAIEAANASGIPVVIQERDVETDKYTVFVNSVTRDIGRLQAEAVAKTLNGKGKVVLLEGLAGSGPAEEARKGHEEVLAKYPGIEVLDTVYSGWDRAVGKSTMEDWLQTYPEIDAVISDSGIQNMGAYEAVEAAGRTDEIKAWTGDSLQAWIRLVNEKKIPGVIVNRPLRFGAIAVDACANLLAGNDVPREWLDPVEALDMNKLADYIAPNTPGSDEYWDWWDLPKAWRQ
ncbi:MAG: sugar transporter substrate-binding protein [Nocardioides sp.]|nr:sugar transporter substrate-binding protein [Nocardioides sp.]